MIVKKTTKGDRLDTKSRSTRNMVFKAPNTRTAISIREFEEADRPPTPDEGLRGGRDSVTSVEDRTGSYVPKAIRPKNVLDSMVERNERTRKVVNDLEKQRNLYGDHRPDRRDNMNVESDLDQYYRMFGESLAQGKMTPQHEAWTRQNAMRQYEDEVRSGKYNPRAKFPYGEGELSREIQTKQVPARTHINELPSKDNLGQGAYIDRETGARATSYGEMRSRAEGLKRLDAKLEKQKKPKPAPVQKPRSGKDLSGFDGQYELMQQIFREPRGRTDLPVRKNVV